MLRSCYFSPLGLECLKKRKGKKMKKYIALSAVAMSFVAAASLNAADDINSMFSEGKVSGQIREFTISRSVELSAGADYTRHANAIGGYLKYETASLSGLSLGAAFYTTYGFLNESKKTDYNQVDPTLFGENNENYSMLGEAYIQYKTGNTLFKGGRQKLVTPMLADDDARMLPNLFEAYVLTNKDIANTTLTLGHVTKFAQGTFGRTYNAGLLAATAGYSHEDSRNQVGSFTNVGTYAFDEKTDGITMAAASYTGIANLKLDLWDYYAHDIMNIIYGEANFSWKCLITDALKPYAAVQIIKEDAVGDEFAGDIDSMYVAGKFGVKVQNFDLSFAYSKTDNNDATNNNGFLQDAVVSPWGGMPAYTQGMVTRHMFLAGTDAAKVAATYNFKDLGANVLATLYYANFNMAANNGYTYGDAKESGFDVIYNPSIVKNLQLRLRANYADDFNVATSGATTSWDEYRFIANYNF